MSALDRFIEEAATRLDLGYRTRTVVEVLSAWLQSHPQGRGGLEQQFEQAGLGTRFRSWRRPGGPPLPILASELERVIGRHALETMARRTMLPPGVLRVVACDLLPGLIGLMPANERHPLLPRRLGRRPSRAPRMRMTGAVPAAKMHGVALRGMVWLLVAVAVGGTAAWLHLTLRSPHWTPPATAARHAPQLSLQQHGTHVYVQGRLPSEAERRSAWNALVSLYGRTHVHGDIALARTAYPPRWLDRLIARLPQLLGDGLQLTFDGGQLQVDTTAMHDEQRIAVSQVLRRDFPELEITGLWGPGIAALARLPVDANSTELVTALNQTTLRFRPGSAALRGDSADTLASVAAALQAAPSGTRLQVGAHTDSTGDPARNLQLSQQRAEVVVQALQAHGAPAAMLVPVGHGQDQPVADNRSEEGRSRNRRVAYTELSPAAR